MTCSTCNVNRVPEQCESFAICPPCSATLPSAERIAYRDAQTLPLRAIECKYIAEQAAFITLHR